MESIAEFSFLEFFDGDSWIVIHRTALVRLTLYLPFIGVFYSFKSLL